MAATQKEEVYDDDIPYESKSYNDIFGEEIKVPEKGNRDLIGRDKENREDGRYSKGSTNGYNQHDIKQRHIGYQ